VLPHISWFAYLVLVRMVLGRALVTRVMGLDRAGVYFSRRSNTVLTACVASGHNAWTFNSCLLGVQSA
jgi:multisubunit Na+/H+ antiporter MnhF subunit